MKVPAFIATREARDKIRDKIELGMAVVVISTAVLKKINDKRNERKSGSADQEQS